MDTFPCGCKGYFETVNTKKRLVVIVNPQCKFDAGREGKTLSFVRYLGRKPQEQS